jgi:hypothetical protein
VTAHLVTEQAPLRHSWIKPERRIHPSESPDGNERTERTCERCSMVKITVHPLHGNPWREWRTKDGMLAQLDATPPCLGSVG